jgi:geranylgeranyl diphosphate synthase type II
MALAQTTDRSREAGITRVTVKGNLSFPAYLERIKPRIDERILQLVNGGWEGPMDRRLEAPLRQGKRMRAGLLMLIFETYGHEKNLEMALDLASAVEIAHAASLIVDDMLDEDDTRHGLPTVHLTVGHKNAMLGTIGLISYPYQITSRYGERCVLEMALTHRAMVRGASREMKGVPSFSAGEMYDGIIENKTGHLFGLAARYGAMAAGCTEEMMEWFSEFGRLTGKAMQIADDLADLEGLLNGKKAGISGSEAILLRCCLGQIKDATDDPDRDEGEHIDPLGKARRKDIEEILNRYLEVAINNAAAAALKLVGADLVQSSRRDHEIPGLPGIPADIAKMVLMERK